MFFNKLRELKNTHSSHINEVKQCSYEIKGVYDQLTRIEHYVADLQKKNKVLFGIHRMTKELIKCRDDQCVHRALQVIGTAVEVERVYIFKNNHNNSRTSQIYEWSNADVPYQRHNEELQNVPYSSIPRWKEYLSIGHLVCGQVRNFPEEERSILEPQDITSLCVVPIFAYGKWEGFIGFDTCSYTKKWTFDEETILSSAADIFAFVFTIHKLDKTSE